MGTRIPPDSHDVIVWRLDESGPPFLNTGTGGMAGDLVQVGSVTPGVPAIWGNGIRFPGTSGNYLRTTDTSLGELSPLSFCAWVYPTSVVNDVHGGVIVNKQMKTIGGSGPTYFCCVSLGLPYFWDGYQWRHSPCLAYTRPDNNEYTCVGGTDPPWLQHAENTQWYLVSGNIVNNDTPRGRREIFINGVQSAINTEDSGIGNNWGNHGPWVVGNSTVSGNGLYGIIGEIRIADVTRPPSYWRQYYAAGVDALPVEECVLDPTKPRSMLPLSVD
jgi:hypothetical protein